MFPTVAAIQAHSTSRLQAEWVKLFASCYLGLEAFGILLGKMCCWNCKTIIINNWQEAPLVSPGEITGVEGCFP